MPVVNSKFELIQSRDGVIVDVGGVLWNTIKRLCDLSLSRFHIGLHTIHKAQQIISVKDAKYYVMETLLNIQSVKDIKIEEVVFSEQFDFYTMR